MTFHFNAALKVEEELYGDAILTTLPERLVKAGPLPGHPAIPQLEPRGALWVAVTAEGADLNIINTHLGLVPREQQIQARRLAGEEWIGQAPMDKPLIVLGDFNATVTTVVYRTFATLLTDARRRARRHGPTATFPSTFPVLRIDHVFVRGPIRVEDLHVPQDPLTRVASDHLPLVVDVSLEP